MTTGMLRALDPAERDALLAHERAHLAGRHHFFLAGAELAALCHPALRSLRAPMGYALERCADEAAAMAVGDRRVAARAIGRAALAARAAEGAEGRPRVALAATAGPVPRRVEALLGRVPPDRASAVRPRRRCWRAWPCPARPRSTRHMICTAASRWRRARAPSTERARRGCLSCEPRPCVAGATPRRRPGVQGSACRRATPSTDGGVVTLGAMGSYYFFR